MLKNLHNPRMNLIKLLRNSKDGKIKIKAISLKKSVNFPDYLLLQRQTSNKISSSFEYLVP